MNILSTASRTLICLAGLGLLSACGENPIIGSWEAPKPSNCSGDNSSDSEFKVDDDLKFDGNIWLVGTQYCHHCQIEGEFDEDAEDPWEADVEISLGSQCNIECNGRGDAKCDMNDDEDEIECELDVGPCSGLEETFEKKGD